MPRLKVRPASLSLLSLLAPLAVVLPVAAVDVPAQGEPVAPEVRQHALAGVDRAALRRLPRLQSAPTVLTGERRTDDFSAVGVTWAKGTGGPAVRVDVRTRTGGRWTDWAHVEVEGDVVPDDGSAEARSATVRDGTAPLWVGRSDGIQVRVIAPRAQRPRDLRLELVDPGTAEADAELGQSAAGGSAAHAAGSRPTIISRRQWGADERLRSGAPAYSSRILMGYVHHTASTNAYSASQAAAQVRAMYAFHTRSRGWGDIGYNFLVDKWGRIYEGRYGGVAANVIGAHTGGFNSRTFAVSLLGNYDGVTPPAAMLSAVNRMFAWKLGINHRDPAGRTTLVSSGGGTSRYARGTSATFNTIAGHRDAGSTSCPGTRAYWQLPNIRRAVRSITGAALFDPKVSADVVPFGSTTPIDVSAKLSKPQTWTLTIRDQRSGRIVRTYGKPAYTWVGATWDLKDTAGELVPPGRYSLLLESRAGTQAALPWSGTVEIESPPIPSGVTVKDLGDGAYKLVQAGHLVRPSAALMKAFRAPGTAIPGAPERLTGFAGDAARPHEGSVWQSAETGWRWVITAGERRSLAPHVVSALGLPAEPPVLPESVLTTVPVGAAWTSTTRHPDGMLVYSGDAAWRIEAGVRRPFSSEAAARAWAAGRQSVAAIPGDLALPEGAVLGPPEGALLRLPTLTYGVVSGGRLRSFVDPATATALGYSMTAALPASLADVTALPVGPAIPLDSTVHPSGTLLRDGDSFWEVVGSARRVVSPSLVSRDFRAPLAPLAGELAALSLATARAPEGFAGRGADGTVRVLSGGRVVTLAPDVALLLYDVLALPALELSDFGHAEEATALVRADRHPDGTIVTADSLLWVLAGGERRPVSAEAATSYTGVPVRPALAGDLELPVGPPAGPRSGSWVGLPTGERFVVEDGVRRAVSPLFARASGLATVPVTVVTAGELAASTRLGPEIG